MEYEYNELPYGLYDDNIPDLKRVRKTDSKILITLDSNECYVSHRIVPFDTWRKEQLALSGKRKDKPSAPKAAGGSSGIIRSVKMSEEDKENILQLHVQGYCSDKIAELLEQPYNKIRQYIYTRVKHLPPPSLDSEQKGEIIALLQQGRSAAAIAKELGYIIRLVQTVINDAQVDKIFAPKRGAERKEAVQSAKAVEVKLVLVPPKKEAPLPNKEVAEQVRQPTALPPTELIKQTTKPKPNMEKINTEPIKTEESAPPAFTPEQVAKIMQYHRIGSYPNYIAKKVGVDLAVLRVYLKTVTK